MTGIVHNGVVYKLGGSVLRVVDESLYRTAGFDPRQMKHTRATSPGSRCPADGVGGGRAPSVAPARDLALGVMQRDFGSPRGVGVNSIVATLRGHADGNFQIVAGTIVDPTIRCRVGTRPVGLAGRRTCLVRRFRSRAATFAA